MSSEPLDSKEPTSLSGEEREFYKKTIFSALNMSTVRNDVSNTAQSNGVGTSFLTLEDDDSSEEYAKSSDTGSGQRSSKNINQRFSLDKIKKRSSRTSGTFNWSSDPVQDEAKATLDAMEARINRNSNSSVSPVSPEKHIISPMSRASKTPAVTRIKERLEELTSVTPSPSQPQINTDNVEESSSLSEKKITSSGRREGSEKLRSKRSESLKKSEELLLLHMENEQTEEDLLQKLEALNRMLDDDPKALKTVKAESASSSKIEPSRTASPFEPLPKYKDDDDQLLDLTGLAEAADEGTMTEEKATEMVAWKSLLSRCRQSEEEVSSPKMNGHSSFVGYTRVLGQNIWKKSDRSFVERQLLKRGGFPNAYRGQIWNLLAQSHLYAHYLEPRYFELIERENPPCEKMIRRDLGRTFPTLEFFKNAGGQESLYRVLSTYSQYDKVVGYCQGISFIAGIFLLNMSDYEAFILLVRYMEAYDMAGLYRPTLDGVEQWLYIFDQFFEEELPTLFRHFQVLGIKSNMTFSQWFMTFFAYRFPLSFVFRMMDVFFMFGWPAIIALSLFLIHSNEKTLLSMNSFEPVAEFMRRKVIEPYRGNPALFIQDALSWALSKSLLTLTSSNPRIWKRIKSAKSKFLTLNSPIVLTLATENETILAQLREERDRASKSQKKFEATIFKSRSLISTLKTENETLQLQVRELSQALAESKSAMADLVEKEINRKSIN